MASLWLAGVTTLAGVVTVVALSAVAVRGRAAARRGGGEPQQLQSLHVLTAHEV
jgi:hypothetical protein